MKDRKKSWIKRSTSFLLAICLSLAFLSQKSIAQSSIPILSWRTHFSYSDVRTVTSGDNKVFASTNNAIFFYDLEDNSLNLINKNNGLSGVGIGTILFDADTDQLIVAYQNGNIDFWSNGNVKTIGTIRESNISSSKRILHIEKVGGQIYFSGDVGIVVYDIARDEITEAYQNLGINGDELIVYKTAFTNDSIYAATESGILSASLATNINRQDFNNWRRTLTGIPFQHITHLNGQIYATSDSDLFMYDAGQWNFSQNFNRPITDLGLSNTTELFLLTENELWQGNNNALSKQLDAESGQVFNEFERFNNQFWLGSSDQGLLQFNSLSTPPNSLKPAGPATDVLLKPTGFDQSVYWLDNQTPSTISRLNLANKTWSSFEPRNESGLPISNLTDLDFGIVNENNISAPVFSSFDQGLFSGGSTIDNSTDLIQAFNQGSIPSFLNGSYNVSSMASQDRDLLWITTPDRSNSLYSLNTSSNEWTAYSLPATFGRSPKDLFITPDGNKWMSIDPARGGGIVVFDETTNRTRSLNTNGGQGGLPGSEVTDMAIDQNFFLWVGTNQGIAFFPNPSIVLENRALTANVPIFENRLLLRDEFITQVVIDPANRKWFGTKNNGLWLFSETGEELIYHFTVDNSPLPSNQVNALFLDPPSGELFIGTDKGTVSFRSDATLGTEQHVNVEIYPNPVNPSFQGNIVINGLANNAFVKITDVSGKLVREIRSNGSTSLWNARDANGTRVKSGVYLLFSSSADGSETFVGKIVVI
ncbi:T9SS type A sorting domain-containing protein [Roseivirga sp. E12]|uniref:type IX secretion system anionic LPS delivery protein PorZ n=1 Tax=Roseivirga sp. E12 TaxID=2819237 RepID=UPI001ABCF4D0|nr:T9SS type A sorting domain-containing protein [Roseivirga sp. E12]MBO3698955.1 T9SS type A sorting domain-containing protein [Roseivirga sp. E12]